MTHHRHSRMRRGASRALRAIADNPWVNIGVGMLLLVTGLLETLAAIYEGYFESAVGIHHSLMIFGVLQMVRSVPDMLEGLKFVEEGEDHEAGAKHIRAT